MAIAHSEASALSPLSWGVCIRLADHAAVRPREGTEEAAHGNSLCDLLGYDVDPLWLRPTFPGCGLYESVEVSLHVITCAEVGACCIMGGLGSPRVSDIAGPGQASEAGYWDFLLQFV